jgi:hypothetical protein
MAMSPFPLDIVSIVVLFGIIYVAVFRNAYARTCRAVRAGGEPRRNKNLTNKEDKVKIRALAICIVPVVLSACAAIPGMTERRQVVTSSKIGCPANEITISEIAGTMTTSTWVATCKGQKYYCGGRNSVGEPMQDISCTAAK